MWAGPFALLVALAMLLPATLGGAAVELRYHVRIAEAGPSLPPGADSSDPFLDSSPDGSLYIMSGHAHAGEYRVLDRDLTTLEVLEPPGEGVVIKGCTLSDWGPRVLMWGGVPGEGNDTVPLYDVGRGEFSEDPLPGGVPALRTIDHARLLASELILMVAGRDGNGTSTVVILETNGSSVRNRTDVPGNRTVIHSDENGNHMPVLDEAGGILVFETFGWSLNETVEPLATPPTVYELHPKRFWTVGTEGGEVTIGLHYGEGFLYRHPGLGGPVQGAVYSMMPNSAINVVTARPGEGGSSLLEVWWAGDGEWPLIYETTTEGTVAFIHHVPGENMAFLIGYEDGSVVQYSIDIREIPPDPSDPWYTEANNIIPMVLVVAIALMWVRRRMRREDVEG